MFRETQEDMKKILIDNTFTSKTVLRLQQKKILTLNTMKLMFYTINLNKEL